MSIKFQVIFNNGRMTFVEYDFPSWESLFFDMLHYDMNGTRIDSKGVAYFSVRKAIRNLVTRAKQNNATVKIVNRKQDIG